MKARTLAFTLVTVLCGVGAASATPVQIVCPAGTSAQEILLDPTKHPYITRIAHCGEVTYVPVGGPKFEIDPEKTIVRILVDEFALTLTREIDTFGRKPAFRGATGFGGFDTKENIGVFELDFSELAGYRVENVGCGVVLPADRIRPHSLRTPQAEERKKNPCFIHRKPKN